MKILDKALSAIGLQIKSANWGDPLLNMIANGGANGDSKYSYQKGVSEGYLGTDIVFSGVDLIASNVASVPLRVMRKVKKAKTGASGQYEELEAWPDHPLQKLLNRPNIRQKQNDFIYASVAFRLLGGDANLWVNTGVEDPLSADAEPLEIWALSPDAASLQSTNGQLYYQMSINQNDGLINPPVAYRQIPVDVVTGRSNVIQWGTFNPNSLAKGVSPLQAANTNIDIYRYGNFWNRTFFHHGCRPSLALATKESLEEHEYDMLKAELNLAYSGLSNGNGRPIILTNGMTAVELSKNPKDADFGASHDTQQKDIARTMKIPPILLNLGGDTTFNNQAEARQYLWDENIIPLTNDYVDSLNLNLLPRYKDKDIVIKPDYSEIPALEPRRVEMWSRADKSGDLTINERRAMKGLQPLDGGDVLLVNSGLVPLEMASFEVPQLDSGK
jgi:HK97 family phage portal protein